MCFSANASFVAAGCIAVVGVATLRHVREPRTLLFASVPLLFAVHQAAEGLVWLGLEGRTGPAALEHATFLFMLYAMAVLPLLMPAAVALMEPVGKRRRAILALALIGAVVAGWQAYAVIVLPSTACIEGHSIAYRNPMTGSMPISALYIAVTCGALLLSSHRVVRWFGALNVAGLTIAEVVKEYAFASVWCFYAALASAIIYSEFSRGSFAALKLDEESPLRKAFLLPWLRPSRSGLNPS